MHCFFSLVSLSFLFSFFFLQSFTYGSTPLPLKQAIHVIGFEQQIIFLVHQIQSWPFPCRLVGKESTCNAGDIGLIPGLGRSPREGKGYPLQYPGLKNSWTVQSMGSQSQIRLSDFHFHFHFRHSADAHPKLKCIFVLITILFKPSSNHPWLIFHFFSKISIFQSHSF